MGDGLNDPVNTLIVFRDKLYAGGRFNATIGGTSIPHIAKWSGSDWTFVGDMGSDVEDLAVFNDNLIVVGKFDVIGPIQYDHVAMWDGFIWSQLGSGNQWSCSCGGRVEWECRRYRRVLRCLGVSRPIALPHGAEQAGARTSTTALTMKDGPWVFSAATWWLAGTSFRQGLHPITVNRIALWDGTNWSGFAGGVDQRVSEIATYNELLHIGGTFVAAGGKPVALHREMGGDQFDLGHLTTSCSPVRVPIRSRSTHK